MRTVLLTADPSHGVSFRVLSDTSERVVKVPAQQLERWAKAEDDWFNIQLEMEKILRDAGVQETK